MTRVLKWSLQQTCQGQPKTEQDLTDAQNLLRETLKRAQIFHLRERHYEKRELFFSLRNRIKLFAGGNQIAKTTSVLAEVLSTCFQFRPWAPDEQPLVELERPGRIILAGPDYQNWCSENLIPKIKELIPWEAVVTQTERHQAGSLSKIEFFTGWTIKIMSYDQDTAKYESWTCNLAAFDEPPPRDKWIATLRGCIKNSAPLLMAYTPVSEPWTFDELYEQAVHVGERSQFKSARGKEIACVTASLFDNPYLSDEQKKWWAEKFERDPDEAEARIYGRYKHLTGRVYKSFDLSKHVRELELLV